jgi:hypothetical protein
MNIFTFLQIKGVYLWISTNLVDFKAHLLTSWRHANCLSDIDWLRLHSVFLSFCVWYAFAFHPRCTCMVNGTTGTCIFEFACELIIVCMERYTYYVAHSHSHMLNLPETQSLISLIVSTLTPTANYLQEFKFELCRLPVCLAGIILRYMKIIHYCHALHSHYDYYLHYFFHDFTIKNVPCITYPP